VAECRRWAARAPRFCRCWRSQKGGKEWGWGGSSPAVCCAATTLPSKGDKETDHVLELLGFSDAAKGVRQLKWLIILIEQKRVKKILLVADNKLLRHACSRNGTQSSTVLRGIHCHLHVGPVPHVSESSPSAVLQRRLIQPEQTYLLFDLIWIWICSIVADCHFMF
jgi:hypothetical protein